ncbi:hypothetical protein I7I53_03224 [Histoplasma capsulatum var. duboisii H88]|uniref:Uncharacterized protein n=1 Tax=Ajellomyces capsulatus (strain H88) TaxID=544711 RepID=A0A8A1LS20_AJEC8|nr:hypothetical protein I7I53_03224 [Histoplasma capsulatum var. duboisii H88]
MIVSMSRTRGWRRVGERGTKPGDERDFIPCLYTLEYTAVAVENQMQEPIGKARWSRFEKLQRSRRLNLGEC